jgi:hypothetical protein
LGSSDFALGLLEFVTFHYLAFQNLIRQGLCDVYRIDADVRRHPFQFASHHDQDRFAQDHRRQKKPAHGLSLSVVVIQQRFGKTFPREHVKELQVRIRSRVERQEIDVGDEILTDRLGERDPVHLPYQAIRQNHPFDSLTCSIVHGLFDLWAP